MSDQAKDVQSFIGRDLHSLLFFEEFTFSRSKFSPPSSSEMEFADAVVMLGDVLLICQIKERALDQAGHAEAERRWFDSKVRGKATKQVRHTLGYIQTYSEIRVPNERGHEFNLAANEFADILKIVIYSPSANLPDDCRRVRHHVSDSAGFIHIVDARDYLEIARTLQVPQEFVRYFKYREMVLTRFAESCADLPEPAIAGHYIGGDPDLPPTIQSAIHLHRLVQDAEEWNLAPLMRRMHDHISVSGINNNYYEILVELAKLPRSAWRMVKQRIRLCIEKVGKDEFTKPYRMTYPDTGCGFVFIPVQSEFVRAKDWPTIRHRALRNFTQLHKYDQRLSKCIGVLIAKDGEYFDIEWCLIAQEWTEDPEIQKALEQNFPFRPVNEAEVHGYLFTENGPADSSRY